MCGEGNSFLITAFPPLISCWKKSYYHLLNTFVLWHIPLKVHCIIITSFSPHYDIFITKSETRKLRHEDVKWVARDLRLETGELHSGFTAGSFEEPCAACRRHCSLLTRSPRCQDHWWKDSHWSTWSSGATAILPLPTCSEYLFFKKPLVIAAMFLQVVWCPLLKGKTRFMMKTWHWFWLIPHRKSGFFIHFCWSKWNGGHKTQHSVGERHSVYSWVLAYVHGDI